MVIAGITIAAALMIVAIFVILSKNKMAGTATDDFLKNIEAQREKQNNQGSSNNSPDDNQAALSYTGVLIEIKADSLVIIEKDTQNKITTSLSDNTPITYSGQRFDRSRFYIGDQLQITASNAGNKLAAEAIVVLVSASPATAAPAPPAANIRPDGTVKPL